MVNKMVKIEKNIEGTVKTFFIGKDDLSFYLANGWKIVENTKPTVKESFQRRGRKRTVSESNGE